MNKTDEKSTDQNQNVLDVENGAANNSTHSTHQIIGEESNGQTHPATIDAGSERSDRCAGGHDGGDEDSESLEDGESSSTKTNCRSSDEESFTDDDSGCDSNDESGYDADDESDSSADNEIHLGLQQAALTPSAGASSDQEPVKNIDSIVMSETEHGETKSVVYSVDGHSNNVLKGDVSSSIKVSSDAIANSVETNINQNDTAPNGNGVDDRIPESTFAHHGILHPDDHDERPIFNAKSTADYLVFIDETNGSPNESDIGEYPPMTADESPGAATAAVETPSDEKNEDDHAEAKPASCALDTENQEEISDATTNLDQ